MSKPLHLRRSNRSAIARQMEIFGAASSFFFYLWWDNLVGNKSSRQRHRRARWLVKKLLSLGPTFIKIGQALSTRADLLPLEYVREFTDLQDRVPEFSAKDAIAIVESELGSSIQALYQSFEPVAIASASIGQVHKARLHTGEEVVVKVQRPGLEGLFNLDFEVLHRLMRTVNNYFPPFRKYDLEAIYQEFFELLFHEIDYIHEGKNADRFRQNFQGHSRILVPQVYWEYTTKRVLTLEYLPGIKISDRASLEATGIDIDEIIELGICAYLKQLLQDGFFQSDPHPGNMAINKDGKLIFYDFGTMAEVKLMNKEQMVKTFFAVLKKDTDEVLNSLIYMGLIEPVPDMTPVKRLIAFILDNFRDKPIDVREFEQIGNEIYLMFKQQPFRLPAQMTFILKSLTTLDGIARALDPKYNLLRAMQPFVKSLALAEGKGKMINLLAQQAREFIKNRLHQPKRSELLIQRLEFLVEQREFKVRVNARKSDRILQRFYLAIKSLIYTFLTGFGLLCATFLLLGGYLNWAIAALSFSAFWFLILLRSLIGLGFKEKVDKLLEE